MRVKVFRTGGFAGIAVHADVDTSQLEPVEEEELSRLVEEAAFFSLPEKVEAQDGGYDRFQYEITVEDGGRVHTVACGDSGMSAALNELVRRALRLGRHTA